MSAALLLARDGNDVWLVERDAFEVGSFIDSISWRRKGVPHFLQPHAFIPRGRLELREHLGDVYDLLIEQGALECNVGPKIPGPPKPGDEELVYLWVRRPMIEWALRTAVLGEARITVLQGATATGVALHANRATAVEVDGSELEVDLVVDAQGRRSSTAAWLARSGVEWPEPSMSDCGVVYYSRYYRVRDGCTLPDGPWPISPRGDLGYLGFATFPGDNSTFAALLAVPPGVPEWRSLKDPAVFARATDSIAVLRSWSDPELVEPITDVLTMAGLHNSLRLVDPSSAVGVLPIGDAYGHTDPTLAHGLSFGIIHAVALAASLREHRDLLDAGAAFASATAPALTERFSLASNMDTQRLAMWRGESPDFSSPDGAFELFSFVAAAAVALVDGDVMRAVVRRLGLLDSTTVFDDDLAMQRQIEQQFKAMQSVPRPAPGPSFEEMSELLASSVRSGVAEGSGS